MAEKQKNKVEVETKVKDKNQRQVEAGSNSGLCNIKVLCGLCGFIAFVTFQKRPFFTSILRTPFEPSRTLYRSSVL